MSVHIKKAGNYENCQLFYPEHAKFILEIK